MKVEWQLLLIYGPPSIKEKNTWWSLLTTLIILGFYRVKFWGKFVIINHDHLICYFINTHELLSNLIFILLLFIIRFVYVSCQHNIKIITNVLLDCFFDWNIYDKLSIIIVDNYSTNNSIIDFCWKSWYFFTLTRWVCFAHEVLCSYFKFGYEGWVESSWWWIP